jgi:hypothetical protein
MTALRNRYSSSEQQMKLVRKAANDGAVPQMCPNPKVPQRRLVGYSKFHNNVRLLFGGRTRARTWDPMIKSHLLPPYPDDDVGNSNQTLEPDMWYGLMQAYAEGFKRY